MATHECTDDDAAGRRADAGEFVTRDCERHGHGKGLQNKEPPQAQSASERLTIECRSPLAANHSVVSAFSRSSVTRAASSSAAFLDLPWPVPSGSLLRKTWISYSR